MHNDLCASRLARLTTLRRKISSQSRATMFNTCRLPDQKQSSHLGRRLLVPVIAMFLLSGCVSTPGPWPVKAPSKTQWQVESSSIDRIPKYAKRYAIRKNNGRWQSASPQDKNAEQLVLTSSGKIFLYTHGETNDFFHCGLLFAFKRSAGCESRFVGKRRAYEHIGDILFLPVSLIYLSYSQFEKIQTDDLAAAVEESGILPMAELELAELERFQNTADSLQRKADADKARLDAEFRRIERDANAKITLRQGVGGLVCQDYTDSFGKPMIRLAYVDRIENNRIQIRTAGVKFKDQPWSTINTGQQVLWDHPGNWYPCE